MQIDDYVVSGHGSPLAELATSLSSVGDYPAVVAACQRSIDSTGESELALEVLGLAAHAMGRHEEALGYAQRLLDVATSHEGSARAHRHMAARLWDIDLRKNWSRIRVLLEQGRAIAPDATDEYVAQTTMAGDFALCRREFELGRALLAEAADRLREVDDKRLAAGLSAHVGIGEARDLMGRGLMDEAAQRLRSELEHLKLYGDRYGEALVVGQLARVARVGGDPRRGDEMLAHQLAVLDRVKPAGFQDWTAVELELRYYLGECALGAEDYGRAREELELVASTATSTGSTEVAAEAVYLLLWVSVLGVDRDATLATLDRFERLVDRPGYEDMRVDLLNLKRSRRFRNLMNPTRAANP